MFVVDANEMALWQRDKGVAWPAFGDEMAETGDARLLCLNCVRGLELEEERKKERKRPRSGSLVAGRRCPCPISFAERQQ